MNTTEREVKHAAQKLTSVYDRGYATVVHLFIAIIRDSPETNRKK
jgi:hypothetical protein